MSKLFKDIPLRELEITNLDNVGKELSIRTDDGRYFVSYNTVIAYIDNTAKIYLDKDYWQYSSTTSKWRNKFLNMTTQETKNEIKLGHIELINLN